MTFLTFQWSISLSDMSRIRIIQVRIQKPDTGTPDTHIISQTNIRHVRNFKSQTGRRHPIVEIRIKTLLRLLCIFHILHCSFITHTGTTRKLLHLNTITDICRQNIIQMFIMATSVLIIIFIFIITVVIAMIITNNIFQPRFKRMNFCNRGSIISLKSMLRTILFPIRTLTGKCLIHVVFPARLYMIKRITIPWVRGTRPCIYLIRKSKHTIFKFTGSTLIIDIAANGIPWTIILIITFIRIVGYSQKSRIGILHHRLTVTRPIIISTIHTKTHCYQP